MEQNNYTNKYLQTLGEQLGTKPVDTPPISKLPTEVPLFKTFQVSNNIKKEFQTKKDELIKKIDDKLKSLTIPKTP